MDSQPAVQGLLAFPLTPFTTNDAVDLDVYADHLRRQLAARPDGLFAACGTGEFTALSLAEYRDVVATAVKVAAEARTPAEDGNVSAEARSSEDGDGPGRQVPVYAGVGGGPQLAREFARIAVECGADGGLLLPPYLVSSTPAGLVRHVRYVADATPLPLIVYQRATARLDPDAALALLDVPTVVGIKDGNGDVDAMLRLVNAVRASGHPRADGFGFLNGIPTAELAAQAYRAIGVDSYSSASLCFVPDIASAFYQAITGDDRTTVERLLTEFYLPFAALRDQVPGYSVALVKAGARLQGLDVGTVRPPLTEPSPEHIDQLQMIITRGRAAL